jgi:hypothetical protein
MPRRSRRDAVAERANQILDEQAERRRLSAQVAAGTRRQRRQQQQSEAQPQPAAEGPTQAHTTRRSRPRTHSDMLTVAIRGALAEKMRGMAERHGMSLAKLMMDAVLVLEVRVAEGYEPGTALASWVAGQARRAADA